MKHNNVKINLSEYFPELISFVGDSYLDWDYIDSLFSKEIDKRIRKANTDGTETIRIQATIYDLIVETKKNNLQAVRLLDFFRKAVAELDINLTLNEKKLVVPTIRSILTALDSRYLDFFGELLVLNNLMKSKTYRLEDIEEKLSNSKTIDFKLRYMANDSLRLVEVVNIHLNPEKVDSNENLIKSFLGNRFIKKIADKKKGLKIDFFLIPVLWGQWKDIQIYSEHFKKNSIDMPYVIEPVAFVTFHDQNDDNYLLHRFGNVSNLFESK
jgi:hypothetical protein